MFRALLVPAIVLGMAALFAIGLGLHSFRAPVAGERTATARACTSPGAGTLRGELPPLERGRPTVLQILPADAYATAYLNLVRQRLGLPIRPGTGFSAEDLQQFNRIVRYAAVDRRGWFSCRALDPGRYLAIATTALAGGALEVEVADFELQPKRDQILTDGRFRPLQDVQ